ncbi:MAG TPA: hypothetical protein VK680_11700 [Solirubrobacteraceae bacterium]|nr:hypothetical protein [Solirubrobacteraceae bacterium]
MIPLLTASLDGLDPNDTTRPNRTDELHLLHQFAERARRATTSE